MKILSHRGYWQCTEEKNSVTAFERSFNLGFGTETDVRDGRGKLVISHDIALDDALDLSAFLRLANVGVDTHQPLTLALNIKADGLASQVRRELAQHPRLDAFVFDMSVPDMRSYLSEGIPTFTRMSEVERQPIWLERSAGVWLDGFDSVWFTTQDIRDLLAQSKRVCVVSPELHRRERLDLWGSLRPLRAEPGLMLCTDHPEQAAQFFETPRNPD